MELGVQRGIFSKELLDRWPSATLYVLVDIWSSQDNYLDIANVGNRVSTRLALATIICTGTEPQSHTVYM